MIFRTDLTGSFSLSPSIKNNVPLIKILISTIQINFPAPGQCIILKRKPKRIRLIAREEKTILIFSKPEEAFPVKKLTIRPAVKIRQQRQL